MYTPVKFKMEKSTEILEFLDKHSFGTIITHSKEDYHATHLPIIYDQQNEHIKLYAHFARANGHWQKSIMYPSLIIFLGQHYYVSPKLYSSKEHVPTWNYTAVHANVIGSLIEGVHRNKELMDKMIRFFEESFLSEWNAMSEKYKSNMYKRIVWVEFEVTHIVGKKKLSQNRSDEEQVLIINNVINK